MNNSLIKRASAQLIALLFALLFTVAPHGDEAQAESIPRLPPEASEALHDAMACLDRKYIYDVIRQQIIHDVAGGDVMKIPSRDQLMHENANAFVAALDRLGAALPAQVDLDETQSIEDKLIAIALDRATHLDRYEAIRHDVLYNKSALSSPARVQRAPPLEMLNPDYRTEGYRLVWEFYVLSPRRPDALQNSYSIALGSVRPESPGALITLLYDFQLACAAPYWLQEGVRLHAGPSTQIPNRLMSWRTDEAIAAFFECVELVEKQRVREGLDEPTVDLIGEIIRPVHQDTAFQLGRGVPVEETSVEKLRSFVESVPRHALSAEHQVHYDRLLRELNHLTFEPIGPKWEIDPVTNEIRRLR